MNRPEYAAPRGDTLLVWCLAGFHSAGLVILLVTIVYLTGSLGDALDGLSTAVGLGLYGVLWATSWWVTRRAVAGLDLIDPDQTVDGRALLGRGTLWGGVNGVLFLLAVLVLVSVELIGDEDVSVQGFVTILAIFLVAGGGVAFVIGSAVGFAFATIDWLLIEAARALWRTGAGGHVTAPTAATHDASGDHRQAS